jgi:hypothetical protein
MNNIKDKQEINYNFIKKHNHYIKNTIDKYNPLSIII